MRAIVLLFDSLNKRYLPPYGATGIHAPNFQRLADRTAMFTNAYVGSMPCMPARRELHTGRYNFLHRSWGPLEPFDDSMPEILKQNGVYTHLTTDHQHYWEDGGATYHSRYNSFEFQRGQEGDPWKAKVGDVDEIDGLGRHKNPRLARQDTVNRSHIPRDDETAFPQHQTVSGGLEFLRTNCDSDNWMLQVETFDPHEPFYAPQKYRDLYPEAYDGPHFDWPDYRRVSESTEEVEHCRREYKALLSFCDAQLGRVLDTMDELDMWNDTMLIVTTDHGFFLGERQWWAKMVQPFFNEVATIPLFIWDPRSRVSGESRTALTQWIDYAPTLYDFFGVDIPEHVQGRALGPIVAQDDVSRRDVLFGQHGGHINMTDGCYVYMRAPGGRSLAGTEDADDGGSGGPGASGSPTERDRSASSEHRAVGPFNYTLMPTHMRSRFSVEELSGVELAGPFTFTKGLQTLRVPARRHPMIEEQVTMLFDLQNDPGQLNPIEDEKLEEEMERRLVAAMKASDAPTELFERYSLGFSSQG
ncbi:MAG: sulfatase [Spirochaetaceae bacterium]|nr:MAG: sulfatase [Spirochaetaceae bacterium]